MATLYALPPASAAADARKPDSWVTAGSARTPVERGRAAAGVAPGKEWGSRGRGGGGAVGVVRSQRACMFWCARAVPACARAFPLADCARVCACAVRLQCVCENVLPQRCRGRAPGPPAPTAVPATRSAAPRTDPASSFSLVAGRAVACGCQVPSLPVPLPLWRQWRRCRKQAAQLGSSRGLLAAAAAGGLERANGAI
jgi:hypothetical protein